MTPRGGVVAFAVLVPALAGGTAAGQSRPAPPEPPRTALLDEIWRELSTHDAFFDPEDARARMLYRECRERLLATDDADERLRHVVRMLSRLGDGHISLTTRWFLPDRPPPPLPLAGGRPLYRPKLRSERFHRDVYVRVDLEDGDDPSGAREEEFRVLEVDGALVTHGSGWSLLNGPEDSEVELLLERRSGERLVHRFRRTERVEPPRYFAPTTQRVVTDPQGRRRTRVEEVVIESRRLEGNLGYIRVAHLVTPQVVRDFNAALDALMDTDGLVLDLRDAHGGYPWIMLPIAGRFLNARAEVATVAARSPLVRGLTQIAGRLGVGPVGRTYANPLVVLVNDATGSMSEGLAFALGDSGRATLIGRPTRGLNAAIRNATLSNGLVLWHSWIRVDRLGRGHYQGVGVEPHERVELPPDEVERLGVREARVRERALQLERAIRLLRERLRSSRRE